MTITEDNDADTVYVDGYPISGFVWGDPCKTCGGTLIYSDLYDSVLCPACNTWLESRCSEAACPYCSKRPPTPLPR